jgi:hypothetical protein
MAESKNTRVTVPKEVGDEIIVRWNGDDPTTYKVTDGHVSVENENVERFLAHFDGSKVAASDNKADASASSK